MFDSLILNHNRKVLKRIASHPRDKRMKSLDEVKQIGIIFTVGSEREWNIIYNFVKEMEHQRKQVYLIGFQHFKQEINYIFTHARTTICHEKDDFSFWRLPKEGVIDGFANRHYDLLIDTTVQPDFFAQYVAAKTVADLKVTYGDTLQAELLPSLHNDLLQIFDLTIQGEGKIDLQAFLHETVHYINMMKGSTHPQQ